MGTAPKHPGPSKSSSSDSAASLLCRVCICSSSSGHVVRYQFIDISIAKGQDGSVEEAVWVGWQPGSAHVERRSSSSSPKLPRRCNSLCHCSTLSYKGRSAPAISDRRMYSLRARGNQDYLLQDILLKRYSIMIDGEQTSPANVIERAVDLHALMVTGSSGYQKCVNYLWRGWLIQDENDPSTFVEYKQKSDTRYWT